MKTWKEVIEGILTLPSMAELKKRLDEERKNYTVLPQKSELFSAFTLCPYERTRVVILGQDPYPDPRHAHGVAFSTRSKQRPDSLRNIFLEIKNELYPEENDLDNLFQSNDLTQWAEQGVLLMNTCLTVREGLPNSHKDLGWDVFVNEIFKELNNHPNDIVFMLWGKNAQKYEYMIDGNRHFVLVSAHPSPLSANNGFFGNGHFGMTNVILRRNFYNSLTKEILLQVDQDRLKRQIERFLSKNSIKIEKGSSKLILDTMFGDIGLFFDVLIPELKSMHEINWKTKARITE